MTFRPWENCDPIERFKQVEKQTEEPLIKASLCHAKICDTFRDWQVVNGIILDEENLTSFKNEAIFAAELVSQFVHICQAIQFAHRVKVFEYGSDETN